MARQQSIYIVCSPRQRVGKTLVARVLTEFLLVQGGVVNAFDLNPNNAALSRFVPQFTLKADLADTRAQMAVFDGLIADDGISKIVDLGDELFEQFFSLCGQIALTEEAYRRNIPVVAIFIADPEPRSVTAYAELHRKFPRLMLVPAQNEQIAHLQNYMHHYPDASGEPPLQIPVLSPFLKSIVEKPGFSFRSYRERQTGMQTELHDWIDQVFVQFRRLKLRLLLQDLKSTLIRR